MTEQGGEFAAEAWLDTRDRAIRKDRFRRGRLPQGSFGVKDSKIPEVSAPGAAVRLGTGRVRGELAGDLLCHQAVVIPELHHAGSMNTPQHRSGRQFPIAWQNWFPNHQHAQVGLLDSFQ